jgi:hypothetical protein
LPDQIFISPSENEKLSGCFARFSKSTSLDSEVITVVALNVSGMVNDHVALSITTVLAGTVWMNSMLGNLPSAGTVMMCGWLISSPVFYAASRPPTNTPPAAAAAVRYTTRTFNSLVVNGETGGWKNNSGIQVTTNADGTITLGPGGTHSRFSADICTAWAAAGGGFPFTGGMAAARGSMFGGGGYFEATISFTGTATSAGGWPSFWANDMEGQSGDASIAWSGGNSIWYEPDIMETPQPGGYGNTVHVWWGSWPSGNDANPQFPGVTYPPGFNPAQPHKYAMLWVPATPNTSGRLTFYLDGVANQSVTYSYWNPASPPPTGTTGIAQASGWHVGAMDPRHLFMFLGSGPNNPMTVYSVEVWQKDASANLVR